MCSLTSRHTPSSSSRRSTKISNKKTRVSRKQLHLNPDVRQNFFQKKDYYKFQRPILAAIVLEYLSCLAQKQLSEIRRWTRQCLFIKRQDCDRSNVSTGGPWALHLHVDHIGLERV
jgi:hypothetical protein